MNSEDNRMEIALELAKLVINNQPLGTIESPNRKRLNIVDVFEESFNVVNKCFMKGKEQDDSNLVKKRNLEPLSKYLGNKNYTPINFT